MAELEWPQMTDNIIHHREYGIVFPDNKGKNIDTRTRNM